MILSVGGGHFNMHYLIIKKHNLCLSDLKHWKKGHGVGNISKTIQTVSSTTDNIAQLYIYYGRKGNFGVIDIYARCNKYQP